MSKASPVREVCDDHAAESSIDMPSVDARPEDLAKWLSLRFGDRLRLFALRRLRDRASAEDVAQEALKRTLEALRDKRVRDVAALPGFVFTTARQVCQHHARSASRQSRAFDRLAGSPHVNSAVDTPDPLTALISEERRTAVRAALTQMKENDRRLLTLTFFDDLGSKAIGEVLGIKAGAVRVRRHRALRKIEAILEVTPAADRELCSRGEGS